MCVQMEYGTTSSNPHWEMTPMLDCILDLALLDHVSSSLLLMMEFPRNQLRLFTFNLFENNNALKCPNLFHFWQLSSWMMIVIKWFYQYYAHCIIHLSVHHVLPIILYNNIVFFFFQLIVLMAEGRVLGRPVLVVSQAVKFATESQTVVMALMKRNVQV